MATALKSGQIRCLCAEHGRATQMRGETGTLRQGSQLSMIHTTHNTRAHSSAWCTTIAEAEGANAKTYCHGGRDVRIWAQCGRTSSQAGRDIARSGIDVLWGVRGLAKQITEGAREGSLTSSRFFANADEAAAAIVKEVKEGDLILVKGSRGVATDKIVAAIRERFPLVGN